MAVLLASYEVRHPWRGLAIHLRVAFALPWLAGRLSREPFSRSRSNQCDSSVGRGNFKWFLGTLCVSALHRGVVFPTLRSSFVVVFLARDVVAVFLGGCDGGGGFPSFLREPLRGLVDPTG